MMAPLQSSRVCRLNTRSRPLHRLPQRLNCMPSPPGTEWDSAGVSVVSLVNAATSESYLSPGGLHEHLAAQSLIYEGAGWTSEQQAVSSSTQTRTMATTSTRASSPATSPPIRRPVNESSMELDDLIDIQRLNTTSSDGPAMPTGLKYKTIMLKVSGEALQGKLGFGVDAEVMRSVAEEVKHLVAAGVRVCIVVGGGNYFRGANAWKGLDRASADYVGMLATVMNALQLQGALEGLGVDTRVQTAIEMREVAEPYIRRRAVAHLNAGRVVIFGAGTGNPFFTTDTAAALRAAEMNVDVFIKATKVDGIYDSDPAKNPAAKKYARLSYRQCTQDSLQVMDETAITLCKENGIPVLVLNMLEKGIFLRAAQGEEVGTVVCENCNEATL